MTQVEERVKELALEKIADRDDLFLVEVKMHSSGKLQVLIDGDQGVSIQDCADLSRHIGYHVEEEGLITQAYRLEVSSPGVDLPLQSFRQYVKNVGRNVQVKVRANSEGKENVQVKEGKLIDVSEERLRIEEILVEKAKRLPKGRKPPVQEVDIPFETIITTKVLISFK